MAVKASTIITLARINDGATGTGIASMIPEFYLSTSKTTQTGGSWVTTPPAWSTGKYMWRRDKIVYKNPTSTFYTAAVCDSSWEAVNEIEVGGRNLLKATESTANMYTYPSSGYKDCKNWITTIPLNGDTYTLSFWAKSTVNGDRIRVHFYDPSNITSVTGSQGQISKATDGLCDFTLSTVLTKYWVTYTIPIGGNSIRNVIIPRLGRDTGVNGTGTVSVQWEKLEKGNKATDWTPAPEDIQDQITTITETVAGVSRKTDDVANKITDKIWQTDVDTSVNQYDQTVGKSIRDRETKTESDIDVIKSTISDVQTTISTKANEDVVEAISTRLNETVNTVSSFQRTIYESYVTKDSMQIMQSSIEQLSTSIASKISASDAQSLINQNKNYWRADFEENGVLCGTTQIDKTGITVGSGNSSYTTKITPTEFAGCYNNVKVFYLNQDETVSERLRVKKGIDLTNLKIVPALQSGIKGIDFLSSGALLL
ncbi:MAG: hypothetical protein PHS82_06160 [Lachnospiraceae bacterium]|nr:hypothetical protein [Lachnospiraceae bacterium]